MKRRIKKFEVCIKEINYGYVVVDADSSKKATDIAIKKYYHGNVVMSDEPEIKTKDVKEIEPMGFRLNS